MDLAWVHEREALLDVARCRGSDGGRTHGLPGFPEHSAERQRRGRRIRDLHPGTSSSTCRSRAGIALACRTHRRRWRPRDTGTGGCPPHVPAHPQRRSPSLRRDPFASRLDICGEPEGRRCERPLRGRLLPVTSDHEPPRRVRAPRLLRGSRAERSGRAAHRCPRRVVADPHRAPAHGKGDADGLSKAVLRQSIEWTRLGRSHPLAGKRASR